MITLRLFRDFKQWTWYVKHRGAIVCIDDRGAWARACTGRSLGVWYKRREAGYVRC